ncbi:MULTISPECIES: N-acetylglucosamine-6-phosphate deacetylase [Metabacillus]|uniref:N-acetylglucosamine-6-phosphate deacetylase n=2 Tax=Metabacillus TaxID=2675233 RepID=A0A179SUH9_9BACI|nr:MULTISPECIES: N-acetylglucosamine-6-phosphate deacetylase [Metabacillus]OAS83953.1 N-acetylglucosamine-6-phosphate deacetylase [Metabacillus litoralis]QNF28329.1 N-acetylglucosamine-6-phosphate deacetylase [Metabacillus sp. KUDC1714]
MNSSSKKVMLQHGTTYAENQVIKNSYIKIDDGRITEIGPTNDLSDSSDYQIINIPDGFSIIPGMIDIHIHGANGADTMDATQEALDIMSSTLPREGTTSFLATTMTEDPSAIANALRNAGEYIDSFQSEGNAEILGIHLEGPFIHKDKAGAQPIHHILDPNLETFKLWKELSNNHIKLVTLAPELPGGGEVLQYLKNQGIIGSIAHSQATYDQVLEAIENGLNHVTHLFNQMTGLHHRDPGIVGAAFLRNELMVEIIVDGIHVRPEIVDLAFNQITDERMILITDSMRAKWLKNGVYDLGGQMVTVKDDHALLDENTLAGSVLKMKDAFKNIQEYAGCDIKSAIKMASENPAKHLKVFDRKGSISIGKDADIVVLDDQMDVFMTMCKGKIAYSKQM